MSAVTLRPAEGGLRSSLSATSFKAPIAYGVIGLLAVLVFGLRSPAGVDSVFVLANAKDFFTLAPLTLPSRSTAIVIGLAILLLAGYAAWEAKNGRKTGGWLPALVGVLAVFGLLVWAAAGRENTPMLFTVLLSTTVVLAIPLAFGALSGTISERAGIVNIAIEGQLLFGAFAAAVFAGLTKNAYIGLIAAPIAGVAIGALLALFAVKYWVDQIVVGVVLNVLVVGLTGFLFGTVLRSNPGLNQNIGLPKLPIPGLSSIPIIGPVLFQQNLLGYLMYAAVIGFQIMLFRSRWGLRVRAVGEHPKAADTVGIKVNRTRVRNTLLGGAIAGLGGAYFTVATGLAFGKDMTAGKGFIALAAMILGRWSPKGAFAAALLFGFAEALQQQFGIMQVPLPSQLLAMLPYLATIFAVAGIVGKARPPAAENVPYKK